MQILNVTGLKKVYTTRFGGSQVTALRQVDFSVEEGEYVAIMGESGSGKTTLLNILAALDKPTAGRVELDGRDMSAVRESDAAAFRRDNLGFVFQEFNLLDTFTLRDNIYLPLVLAGRPYRELKARLDPIARQLGILTDPSQALTGADLDTLSDEELTQTVDRYSVYARVQPEHKVRIVTAWRRRGAVTAMTGDGVNDAPSIKSADIGVGMGITGTDVTKNVADMVLSDDNFATIVGAVAEGRRIYDNIRKAIAFLLASNMSEVLGVFTAALLGFTLLNPVHLLFINLITDCFPALALGLERPEPDIMDRPPRSAKDGVFSGGLGFDIAYQGVLITVITLISYLIGHCMEVGYFEMPRGVSPDGMTMAFLTMSMCEIFHSFNMRSQRRSVFTLRGHNRVLWAAMLGSLILTTVVLEVPPIAAAFGFTPVGWAEYGIALALAVLVIPVVELVKFIQRRRAR